MKILMAGSSGLIGSALRALLANGDHEIIRLARPGSRTREGEFTWDPEEGDLPAEALDGADAVVNLCGENIGEGRWTAKKKQRIRDSRRNSTRVIADALAGLEDCPKTLVNASAIGFYGDRGDEVLEEGCAPGTSFLATVCREWEESARPAEEAGVRTVRLRFGMVLSPKGGGLAKMLFPFRMGVGGTVGSGRQFLSWVAIDDAASAIEHALINESVEGPVNVVSPNPVTNREFTKTLGRILSRPTVLPMPAFAARLAFGEMAEELLLASTRVRPAKLQQTGYEFRFSELADALQHLLK